MLEYVGTLINWVVNRQIKNIFQVWDTCLATLSLSPPALLRSAGALILLLSPHLDQLEPILCMISIISAGRTECVRL